MPSINMTNVDTDSYAKTSSTLFSICLQGPYTFFFFFLQHRIPLCTLTHRILAHKPSTQHCVTHQPKKLYLQSDKTSRTNNPHTWYDILPHSIMSKYEWFFFLSSICLCWRHFDFDILSGRGRNVDREKEYYRWGRCNEIWAKIKQKIYFWDLSTVVKIGVLRVSVDFISYELGGGFLYNVLWVWRDFIALICIWSTNSKKGKMTVLSLMLRLDKWSGC